MKGTLCIWPCAHSSEATWFLFNCPGRIPLTNNFFYQGWLCCITYLYTIRLNSLPQQTNMGKWILSCLHTEREYFLNVIQFTAWVVILHLEKVDLQLLYHFPSFPLKFHRRNALKDRGKLNFLKNAILRCI